MASKPKRLFDRSRIRLDLCGIGLFGETFSSLPLSFCLTRLSRIEWNEPDEDKAGWREYLFIVGLGCLVYGLPFILLQLGDVGAWVSVGIYSALILASLRAAMEFFRPADHPDFAVLEGGMQGLQRQPGYVLMLWFTRYVNLAFFFWALFCAINVISGNTAYRSSCAGMPSNGDLLYFSFATITTLGYGDVVPATGIAKGLTVVEVLAGMWILLTCLSAATQHLATQWGKKGERE